MVLGSNLIADRKGLLNHGGTSFDMKILRQNVNSDPVHEQILFPLMLFGETSQGTGFHHFSHLKMNKKLMQLRQQSSQV